MSIPYKLLPTGFDSWYVKLYRELCQLLGSPLKFELGWVASEKKLVIHTDRLDDDKLEQVRMMAEEYMPAWVRLVQYNHDISIPWQEIPEGFTVVEYLESDGNQWINTEFTPTTSENFKADLVVLVKAGVRYAQGISCAFCRSFWVTPIHDGWRVSGYSANTTNHVPLDTKVKIELSPDFVSFLGKKLQISKLDTSAITEIPSGPEGSASIKLFAYTDGASYTGEWLKGYIYEFFATFADQKTHMVPALDERGAPCFYCLHRKITFYNQGTGDFLYPGKAAEVNTFSRRRTVTFAQLTEHGVRRLYHVPKGYNGTKEEYAAENGFKPLVETPMPEEGYWEPHWQETEEEIVLNWVATNPPVEESFS